MAGWVDPIAVGLPYSGRRGCQSPKSIDERVYWRQGAESLLGWLIVGRVAI